MDGLRHDLRAAWLALRATPGATLAAILILALGTGANTAVLALTYGILVRPLPYPAPERLALAAIRVSDGKETMFQRGDVDRLTRELTAVDASAGYSKRDMTVRVAGAPRLLPVAEATETFFAVLGVAPAAGRAAVGEPDAAVISARFAAALAPAPDAALGRTLVIGDQPRTVVGVMPAAFGFPADDVDVWIQAPPPPVQPAGGPRKLEWPRYRLIARLRAGATEAELAADVSRVMDGVRPGFSKGSAAAVRLLPGDAAAASRPALLAAAAASALVLLVACANVAVLLLGRQTRRSRELAMRLALGASNWRLVRATFLESVLLATAGAVLGLAVAAGVVRGFVAAAAGIVPRLADVRLDLPVLMAAVLVAAVVAVLAGLAPAAALARRDFLQTFRASAADGRAARRLRGGLIAVQIGLSFVLIAGSLLLARTVARLSAVDMGVEPSGLITARLALSDEELAPVPAATARVEAILDRVRRLPGVQAAGVGANVPPATEPMRIFYSIVIDERRDMLAVSLGSGTAGFMEALGARLVRGRFLTDADARDGEAVVVLSESAERFFALGKDILGQELIARIPAVTGYARKPRVVGIVRDVKYAGLDAPAAAAMYVPWRYLPRGTSYLTVRSAQPAAALAPAIREAVRAADPTLASPVLRTMDEQIAASIADRRLRLLPAAGFAVVALAMALVGVAATLSRAVAERRRELAVRAAVGATPARLTGMVLAEGVTVTAVGLALGLLLTYAAGGSFAHFLYGVGPSDPATLAAVTLIVAVGALAAALLPAARAAQTRPVELLRGE